MKSLAAYVGIVILAVALAAVVGLPLLRPSKKATYAKPPAPPPATVPSRERHTNTLYLAPPSKLAPAETSQPAPTLIMRELTRQALLIAARDGLGLFTRDAVLREPPPDHDVRDGSLRVDVGFRQGLVLPLSVFEDGPRAIKIYSQELRMAGDPNSPDMLKLIEEVEGHSRGKYFKLLKDAGFSDAATTAQSQHSETPDLQKARERLDELTEISQFAAVRSAHAAIKAGPSPAATGVLVRGYANLAQLTRAAWSPATDVYAARSLLYAQRMVATDPKDPFARWHRAYALSLFGLHRAALQEINEARKLGKEAQEATPTPPWAELLEPLCRYQTDKLIKTAAEKKPIAPLAMFMAFLSAENSGSDTYSIEIAKKALEANPRCVRIIEAICEKSGVAYLHVATELGPSVHEAALPDEMQELSPLPKNVEGAVAQLRSQRQPVVVAAVGAELVKAPDEAEPSWAAVGRTLQEIDFFQVRRRAEFMSQWWGVDTSDFVRQTTPLVADHPYFPLIKAYGLYTGIHPDPFQVFQTLNNFEFVDPRVNMHSAVQFTQIAGNPDRLIGDVAWRRALADMDLTAYDIEPTLPVNHPDQLRRDPNGPLRRAWQARVASPFNPLAKGAYVLLSWKEAEPQLDLWTKREHPDHPALTGALARKYQELNHYDKSENYWLAYLKVAHDGPAYRDLADMYLKEGKEDKWLATLQESLKSDEIGLEHAITNEKIARHYLETKAFERAKPYVDAAAQSGSESSMRLAAECYEGLRQWDVAEKFVRDQVDRYQRQWVWLAWCKRTGHGDLAAATTAANQLLQTIAGQTNENALTMRSAIAMLENNLPEAASTLKTAFDMTSSPRGAVHLALIYLQQGKKKEALEVLHQGALSGDAYMALRHMAVIAQYMAASLDPDPTRFSVSDIHFAVDNLTPPAQIDSWYVTGKFLKIQGRKEEAVECLKRAAVPNADQITAILAIQELREMGEMPPAF